LHRNENTSIAAARSFLQVRGGSISFFEPPADGLPTRLVAFECNDANFSFDPNRIFTRDGADASLKQYSPPTSTVTPDVIDAVVDFGSVVLARYGYAKLPVIVVMHNNGPNYSIDSYLPGGEFASDAAQVSVGDNTTTRNFFLVTRLQIYEGLVALGQNVVLQSQNATNDGSLSYLAMTGSKNYINIEGAAADGSDGAEVAQQVGQLVAVANLVLGAENLCSTWQTALLVLGLVALLLAATLILVGLTIWRQKRKAAGYEAIEEQNHY
jgi:hypothetical protein